MYNITIFHYHLLTGGITQVISSSVKAILHTAADKFDITIVCGRNEHRSQLIDSMNRELKNAGIDAVVRSEHMPEIDYIVEQSTQPSIEKIKQHLTERFSGSIWWVHNYHIGKNPLFTEALVQVAREQPQQKIVLHLHDFPESGRFSNLQALYESLN